MVTTQATTAVTRQLIIVHIIILLLSYKAVHHLHVRSIKVQQTVKK